MGIMKMNMSQGNVEHDAPATVEYDEEILSSGWNPVVGLTQLVPEAKRHTFPAELANVDLEQFLKKMYG
jgi:hypothetical protein